MKKQAWAVFMALLCYVAHGQSLRERIVFHPEVKDVDALLEKKSPGSLHKLNTIIVKKSSVYKMESLLAMVNDVKIQIQHTEKRFNIKEEQNLIAFMFAWQKCIQFASTLDDKMTLNRMLKAWDESLLNDDKLAPIQIYALSNEWNRIFLTDVFWRQLRDSKNDSVVTAMCYVLYRNGNSEDLLKLLNQHDSENRQVRANLLMNAHNWLGHRLYGKQKEFGPPTLPPRPENFFD